MGPELADNGVYGNASPDADGDDPAALDSVAAIGGGGAAVAVQGQGPRGATRQEWRTPPLWGVRDSGPYLHDGRANTLEQAIALHGGEAARSAQRFYELSPEERMQVLAFLKSLRAPQTQVASR